MDNVFMKPIEVPGPVEKSEQVEAESLNDSTFEPGSHIERSMDFQQAEAIQGALTTVMDNAEIFTAQEIQPVEPLEEISSSPVPQPVPYPATERDNHIEAIPEPIPHPGPEISVHVEAIPDPIPRPESEDGGHIEAIPDPIPRPESEDGGHIEAIPDPIPHPESEDGGHIEAIPDPFPQPEIRGGGHVEAIPDPIPYPELRDDGQVEAIPEPIPYPEQRGDGQVEAIPEPIPHPEIRSGGQVEAIPEPNPHPVSEELAGELVMESMVNSSGMEAAPTMPGAADNILDFETSQLRETVNLNGIPKPGTAADTVEGKPTIIDTNFMVQNDNDRSGIIFGDGQKGAIPGGQNEIDAQYQYEPGIVSNTLAGLKDEQAFEQNYHVQGMIAENAKLYDAAVSVLLGDLSIPEIELAISPETGDVPIGPNAERTIEGSEISPASEGQTETIEPDGETGEEWVPPEMYISVGADGKMTIVDASGKPIDSPPIILNPMDPPPYYAYYPGLVDKNGDTIKFEISAFKGTNTEIFYYINTQGQVIAVDVNGKPLDSQPIVINPLDKPPYYAYYPGVYDANGDTIKIQLSQYMGPTTGYQLLEYGQRYDTGEYPGGVPVPIYDIHYLIDKNGNVVVVDDNGKPLDSPPTVVQSTTPNGKTAYMAFYPGVVDENGDLFLFPVSSYNPSLENIYCYPDSQGKMVAVDTNGKPLDIQPVVMSPTGTPPYYAFYPGVVDENGETIKVELQTYKGPMDNIYFYQDNMGKLIVVDANGKPLDCQPIVSTTSDPNTLLVTYPGLVDENGSTISVEIKPYHDSFQFYTTNEWHSIDGEWHSMMVDINGDPIDYHPPEIYYSIDSQGKMTVVDANGKPLNSPPLILTTNETPPTYYYTYPGVHDRSGNPFKLEIPPYHPPSAAPTAKQPT